MVKGYNEQNTERLEKALLEISEKLNVLIALNLRLLMKNQDFDGEGKRRKGISELVGYLHEFGLEAKDIAIILGSPLQSVRTLLTPKRRKK